MAAAYRRTIERMSSVLETAEEARPDLDRTGFNLAVWKRLLADPELAALPFRIETDEHGQMIMSPPPAPNHGIKQSEIAGWLRNATSGGKVITECPISTSRGVKAADVAWCSLDIWRKTEQEACFVMSPEICVEVLSPSNTTSEIGEKKQLYFESGALEVWICDRDGNMRFYVNETPETFLTKSRLFPDFPSTVE